VLVGHHVGFDRELVQVAAERHGFPVPDWPALDTMRLAIGLEEAGVLGEPPIERFELDDLCRRFDVEMHDRHTAAGDAYLTAQVFLRLWRIAKKAGLDLMHFRELPTETDS